MAGRSAVKTETLADATGTFDVCVWTPDVVSRVIVFGVGAGGDPGRHAPLLEALARQQCLVAAPAFERMTSPQPSLAALVERIDRLALTARAFAQGALPVVGVGHSIGATSLMSLAGATLWLGPDRWVSPRPETHLRGLALLAPPTGYFLGPGALNDVRVPLWVRGGALDTITPPEQLACLSGPRGTRGPLDVQVLEACDHFTFMHRPPPHAAAVHPDPAAFFASLEAGVTRFVLGACGPTDRPA